MGMRSVITRSKLIYFSHYLLKRLAFIIIVYIKEK